MLLVAALTALISVNGAVAALLPVVVVIAVRTGRAPSQLLMPLVFGAHAGSMLALTGTPVNVIVSTYAAELTGDGLRLLRVRAGRRPAAARDDRGRAPARPAAAPGAAAAVAARRPSRHARTLVEQYGLDARELPAHIDVAAALIGRDTGLAEVIIPPRSPLIGEHGVPGHGHRAGDLVVLAIQRGGEDLGPGEPTLAAGDALLLQGTWDAIADHAGAGACSGGLPELVRRQAVPLGRGAAARSRSWPG